MWLSTQRLDLMCVSERFSLVAVGARYSLCAAADFRGVERKLHPFVIGG